MFDNEARNGTVPAGLTPIDYDMSQMWPSLRIPIEKMAAGIIPAKEPEKCPYEPPTILFSSLEKKGDCVHPCDGKPVK